MPAHMQRSNDPPTPPAGAAVTAAELRAAVEVAAGRRAATLALCGGRLLNVFSGAIEPATVLVAGRVVSALLPPGVEVHAETIVELDGAYLAPGLIDGHVHIESSLVTPAAYAEGVLPRGVTGVVCDPHELANVAGVPGVMWLLERSEGLPLDVWVTAPSCVPSTPFETAGAALGLEDIAALLRHPRVVGVAELMSVAAVVAGEPDELGKVMLAEGARKTAEGHAPALRGPALQAYLASGIGSDHESTELEEGMEKLRSGAYLMVREGSVTRNLDALMPLVRPQHADRVGFVTDDRLPHDLLTEGGVDTLVRRALRAGVDPVYAVRCASYNNARHYRLPRRGAVAPGYLADLVVLEPELPDFRARVVYKEGRRVAAAGRLDSALIPAPAGAEATAAVRDTVRLRPLAPEDFRLADAGGEVRVIRAIPNQVLTEAVTLRPTVEGGVVVADPERDLAKLVCAERHGRNGSVAVGLVCGFGLRRGALASSVGHDHHNVMAVGVDDADLARACARLAELGGGFVAVLDGEVLAELRLEIAGLVTDAPLTEVRERLDALEEAATRLGVTLPSPYMALSFLGLPVIPELRLTDRGLVDVRENRVVALRAVD